MPTYEINIPGSGTYQVQSDRELSDVEAYNVALSQATPRTAGEEFVRGAGLAARGAAPALAGAAIGAPLGPVGMLAGSLALPAAEIASQAANVVLPQQYQIPSPSGAVENLLTKLGFPVAETTMERAVQAGGGALGGTATQLATLPTLAKTATTEIGRSVAGQLAQSPGRQLAAAAPAAMAAQGTAEATGSPVAGMVAGMAAGAPFGIGVKSKPTETIPSVETLKRTSGTLYDFAKDAGVLFKINEFNGFVNNLRKEMFTEGLDKQIHPNVYRALERMSDTPNRPLTLEEIDILRRVAGASFKSTIPDERRLGGILVNKLDNFVENAGKDKLVSSDPKTIEALTNARTLWKQAKKAEVLEDIFESAEIRQARYSQSGFENALRSKLITLADNPAQMRAFSKTEQDAIKAAAKGGNVQNFLRWAGKLSPSSVVAGAGGAYLGASLFGPAGAVIAPVVGAGARLGAERMQTQQFRRLEDMLKLGRQPRTPISGVTPIITRGLIAPYQTPLNVTEEELRNISGM